MSTNLLECYTEFKKGEPPSIFRQFSLQLEISIVVRKLRLEYQLKALKKSVQLNSLR